MRALALFAIGALTLSGREAWLAIEARARRGADAVEVALVAVRAGPAVGPTGEGADPVVQCEVDAHPCDALAALIAEVTVGFVARFEAHTVDASHARGARACAGLRAVDLIRHHQAYPPGAGLVPVAELTIRDVGACVVAVLVVRDALTWDVAVDVLAVEVCRAVAVVVAVLSAEGFAAAPSEAVAVGAMGAVLTGVARDARFEVAYWVEEAGPAFVVVFEGAEVS